MRDWLKRHAGALAIVFAALTSLLCVAVVVQAVMLHAQGWRPDWGTVPAWLAAAGGIATVAAFVVAYRLYQHERDDRKAREEADRRRQAELITVWEIEGASGGSAEDSSDWSGVRLGLINASKALAYNVQIRLTGEPPDSVTHDELREGPVTRFFVSVLQPGQWQGVARLGDPRLTPTRIEVYFQDQAQHRWTRDINLGTLTAADSELFTATNPFTLEDAQRREREGADFLQSERLDIQPLRFIRRRDNSNVVALGDELFWRLRAIDPIENWPLYSQREAVSSLPRAEALQFANIRALQMISDSIQELI